MSSTGIARCPMCNKDNDGWCSMCTGSGYVTSEVSRRYYKELPKVYAHTIATQVAGELRDERWKKKYN